MKRTVHLEKDENQTKQNKTEMCELYTWVCVKSKYDETSIVWNAQEHQLLSQIIRKSEEWKKRASRTNTQPSSLFYSFKQSKLLEYTFEYII